MSKVPALTGIPTTLPLPNTTPTPAAGEDVTGASVQNAAQGLLNADLTLQSAMCIGLVPAMNQNWFKNAGTVATGTLALSTIPASDQGSMALPLPHGSRIKTVVMRLVPAVHVSLPGTMPSLVLYKITIAGVLSSSWTVTDASTPAATYSVAHDITVDIGSFETIDRTAFVYLLVFTQEAGVNSADGDVGQPRISLA